MIKFSKLRALLAYKEMSQLELASKTGIRQPTISAICTGSIKRLPIEALDLICFVLECQPGDIMEFVRPEFPQGWSRVNLKTGECTPIGGTVRSNEAEPK